MPTVVGSYIQVFNHDLLGTPKVSAPLLPTTNNKWLSAFLVLTADDVPLIKIYQNLPKQQQDTCTM